MNRSMFLRAATSVAFVAFSSGLGTLGARSAGAADEPRTVLLTGFEPFGPKRPPNPSWEGIKALDGREWNGCRIVARELPVVWGEPGRRIEALAAELKPVAVFSFGQGRKDAFTVEALARNLRAPIPDNAGAKPLTPTILDDGPVAFLASSDAARIAKSLAERGHTVRLSDDAGRYLCEETLYSLESLKKTGKLRGSVLFCHVPPLGATVGGRVVDAPLVEKFVLDVLEAWREMQTDHQPQAAVRKASFRVEAEGQQAPDAAVREKDVRAFVERYFKVWSEQDMGGYDDCFMTDAVVQHVDGQGQLFSIARPQFVASQREAHRRSASRMVEVPESIEIRFEQQLARAVVYWKLTAGARVQKGYDHFTLKLDRGRWRIANLLFYSTSDE